MHLFSPEEFGIMEGKAFDVRRSRNKRLLAGDDLFNAVGEGFPIISGDIQGAEVEDDSLSGAFSGSYGLHESMIDKDFVIA